MTISPNNMTLTAFTCISHAKILPVRTSQKLEINGIGVTHIKKHQQRTGFSLGRICGGKKPNIYSQTIQK
jgi:hypothetical protein